MPAPRPGTMSQLDAPTNSGAFLPKLFCVNIPDQAASLTRIYRHYARAAGVIREFNGYAAITGTVTIDILKNGASVLSGTFTLANNTRKQLKGLGTGGVGSGFFNTLSDDNKGKLRYEAGDYLEISVVTAATSTVAGGELDLELDEAQPVPGSSDA